MSKRRTYPAPCCEPLGDRCLLSVGGVTTTVGFPVSGQVVKYIGDTTLSASVVAETPTFSHIVVDGSDYEDHITVVAFWPTYVTLHLEQWSGGQRFFDQTVNVFAPLLTVLKNGVKILGRGCR
jgi:hypothetical protein